MKILIVDDELDLRESISDLIQIEYRCKIDLCGDGDHAYQACSDKVYDLIILDYRMPFVTGVEFYNKLRMNKNQNANSQILFLSGFIEEVSELIPRKEHIYFESKPIQPSRLLNFIHDVYVEETAC